MHFICYRPQRSWAKVMFLQASVILSTGGVCLSACWDTPLPPDQTPLRPDPPETRPPPDQTSSPRDRPWEADASIWSMCGRYASYWNAFLFPLFLSISGTGIPIVYYRVKYCIGNQMTSLRHHLSSRILDFTWRISALMGRVKLLWKIHSQLAGSQ